MDRVLFMLCPHIFYPICTLYPSPLWYTFVYKYQCKKFSNIKQTEHCLQSLLKISVKCVNFQKLYIKPFIMKKQDYL